MWCMRAAKFLFITLFLVGGCGSDDAAPSGGSGGASGGGGQAGGGGTGGSGGSAGGSAGGGAGGQAFQDAPTTAVSYQATDEDFPNPERGFFRNINLLKDTNVSWVSDADSTLARSYIRLDDYRQADIPASVLADLDTGFAAARTAGIKVIPRVAYNFGSGDPDAPKSWVLKHITQLTPSLQKNADVIAAMEAGFIGAWGEWHSSTNGLDNPTDRQEIVEALLAALPQSRMVMLRTPHYISDIFPTPLTSAQAWDGSNQARMGHHNDCFLANDSDAGTYSPAPIEDRKKYLEQSTQFTAVGGETCQVTVSEHRTDCPTALEELARFHFSMLNLDFYVGDLDRWKTEGCFDEIHRRLGYRFSLSQAALPESIRPGGRFVLDFDVVSSGFGALYNPRPVVLVLEGNGKRLETPLESLDPRRWAPGSTRSESVHVELPATLSPGSYTVALRLPDAADALSARPEYAVRFANAGVWNASTGDNELGTIEVSDAAPGDANAAATELRVLP